MPQITLLHANEDTALAEQLERQLLHADNRVQIAHNNNARYGSNIEEAWTKTLYTSHLFIVLLSADLTSDERVTHYVQDAMRVEPGRVIVVQIRACMLESGHTFSGHPVIPNRPVTSYSGSTKESTWVAIVYHILEKLEEVSEPIGYHAPVQLPFQQPTPSTRKFVSQRTPVQPRPVFVETPVVPAVESKPTMSQEKREMDVVVLSSPQDKAWLPFIDRTFKIMQRTGNITFTMHHNPEHAQDAILDADLTLILVSPDFLASDHLDLYRAMVPVLGSKRAIVPVLLRECKLDMNIVTIPRNGAIKKTGNDAAWSDMSSEIRRVLKDR